MAYWASKGLYGQPVARGTGVGEGSGAVFRDWGSASPASGVPADGWSARLTGEIFLASSGAYEFRAYSDDGVRVVIDDQPVVDSWSDGVGWREGFATFNNAAAGSWHKIRVDFYDCEHHDARCPAGV